MFYGIGKRQARACIFAGRTGKPTHNIAGRKRAKRHYIRKGQRSRYSRPLVAGLIYRTKTKEQIA